MVLMIKTAAMSKNAIFDCRRNLPSYGSSSAFFFAGTVLFAGIKIISQNARTIQSRPREIRGKREMSDLVKKNLPTYYTYPSRVWSCHVSWYCPRKSYEQKNAFSWIVWLLIYSCRTTVAAFLSLSLGSRIFGFSSDEITSLSSSIRSIRPVGRQNLRGLSAW